MPVALPQTVRVLGAAVAARRKCAAARRTHSAALGYAPVVSANAFVSGKSQWMGRAKRANVCSTFSPRVFHIVPVLP